MSRAELGKVIDELADLFEYGHLVAATDPVQLLREAVTEIKLLRRMVNELRVENRLLRNQQEETKCTK